MATVEDRVAKLEQDVQALREVGVIAGQQANAFGVELVRRDISELRAETQGGLADLSARLDGVERQVAAMHGTLTAVDGKLDELLRR
jgi:hypothetical protein